MNKYNLYTLVIIISLAVVGLILAVFDFHQEYISDIQITDLGTLPGGVNSTASDINDAGDIVGSSDTAGGVNHAFIIHNSIMQDLGTLAGGTKSMAYGINDIGQVVGTATNAAGIFHGFVWQSGSGIRDLGAYPPDDEIGSSSRANAINNNGLISGNVDMAGVIWNLAGTPNYPPYPPYVRVTDPNPFKPAKANDINNSGQAVGTSMSDSQGFRWTAGTLEMLKVLGALDDKGLGINNSGQMVGRAALAPPLRYHAVLWSTPSTVKDIGTLGGANSIAYELNDGNLVVGHSENSDGKTLAFIWRRSLGMKSLGTLGGNNSRAFAINTAGQIVGESDTADGKVHATLWTVTIKNKFAIRRTIREFFTRKKT